MGVRDAGDMRRANRRIWEELEGKDTEEPGRGTGTRELQKA